AESESRPARRVSEEHVERPHPRFPQREGGRPRARGAVTSSGQEMIASHLRCIKYIKLLYSIDLSAICLNNRRSQGVDGGLSLSVVFAAPFRHPQRETG